MQKLETWMNVFSCKSLFINRNLNHSCRANWYYTSERSKKLLLLIMNRTVSPCRISAGKVATLSIESFGIVSKILSFVFQILFFSFKMYFIILFLRRFWKHQCLILRCCAPSSDNFSEKGPRTCQAKLMIHDYYILKHSKSHICTWTIFTQQLARVILIVRNAKNIKFYAN